MVFSSDVSEKYEMQNKSAKFHVEYTRFHALNLNFKIKILLIILFLCETQELCL